jgi:hypothetical protein
MGWGKWGGTKWHVGQGSSGAKWRGVEPIVRDSDSGSWAIEATACMNLLMLGPMKGDS